MKKFAVLALAAIVSFTATTAKADIDNLNIGGDAMMMYFYGSDFDRNSSVGDQVDFYRMEAHLFFQADLDDNVSVRTSLEVDRAFNQASGAASHSLTGSNNDLEIYLEELVVCIKGIWGTNFNYSVGRQFLNYGDNQNAEDFNGWWGNSFVLGDANTNAPFLLQQIGSYEIDAFDASVVQYEGETFTTDLAFYTQNEELGFSAPGRDDDAWGLLLYNSYFGIEGHQIDLYINYNEQSGTMGQVGFDGEQYTFGARAAGDINENLAYKAEVAYQMQDANTVGVAENEGFAAQAGLNYHPDTDYNPNIGIIYTLLQEDNNGNGFASPYEAKTYGLLAEGIVKTTVPSGNFTNMNVFNLNGGLEFTDNVAGTLDLYYFLLDEDNATNDDDGGIEIDGQIDYRFSDNLTTFLGGGVLFPGDALENGAGNDDAAYFIRTGFKVNF
jgi:hypothetical protein